MTEKSDQDILRILEAINSTKDTLHKKIDMVKLDFDSKLDSLKTSSGTLSEELIKQGYVLEATTDTLRSIVQERRQEAIDKAIEIKEREAQRREDLRLARAEKRQLVFWLVGTVISCVAALAGVGRYLAA